MDIIGDFVRGMVSVLKITGASLMYRYPYRNSAEGLHKDWLSISRDIESVIGKLEENDRENNA